MSSLRPLVLPTRSRRGMMGRLDKALDEAKANGWTVVSMKDDWKTIFSPKD